MFDQDPFEEYLGDLEENVDNALSNACKMSNKSSYVKVVSDLHHLFNDNRHYFQNYQCIQVYGSRMSGLATNRSDIDCFAQMNSNYHTQTLSHYEIVAAIENIANLIRKSNNFRCIQSLTGAKVPIVRAKHVATKTKIDISSTDGLGVRNTRIIKHWLDLHDQEARKFALFMRNWFDMSIFQRSTFLHKTLDLLVIYYMQQKNLLPSFHQVKQHTQYSIVVDGIETSFNSKIGCAEQYGKHTMDDYKDYLKGFFLYYANFEFDKYVVCPYVGNCFTLIKKSNIFNYKMLRDYHEQLKKVNLDKPMVVLGFLKLDRNFSSQMGRKRLRQFQKFCTQSCELLDQYI